MNRIETAAALFAQDFSCAQSILSSFGEQFGLPAEMGLRLAGGFGGGMARMGEVCGAVTGAMMVIGLKYGKTSPSDPDAQEITYQRVQEFVDRFQAEHGSIYCRDQLGCVIIHPDARRYARDHGLFATVCPALVRASARILDSMLSKEED